MSAPIVSFVICTHRRFDLLGDVLSGLAKQSALSDQFEVIVVDNDRVSNSKVVAAVEKVRPIIQVSYLHEPAIGLSYARNAGGLVVRSEYVGYLDDDVRIPFHYVEQIIKIIEQQAPDVFGGPFRAFYLEPKPQWFKDEYGSGGWGASLRMLTSKESLYGMNIGFRKAILEEIGWFHPELGMVGQKLGYGEETMAQMEAWKKHPALRVCYDPQAYVLHLVPSRKMTLTWRLKMAFQIGWYQAYFWQPENEKRYLQRHSIWYGIRAVLSIAKSVVNIPFHNRFQYPFWQNYVYEVVAHRISFLAAQNRYQVDLLKGE